MKKIYIPIFFGTVTAIWIYITLISFLYEGILSPFYIVSTLLWLSIGFFLFVKHKKQKKIIHMLLGIIAFSFSVYIILYFRLIKAPTLPDIKLSYVKIDRSNEVANDNNYKLQILSDYNLFTPIDSLGFVAVFMHCPLDKDFENYSKDNVIYLRDDCFYCDNTKIDTTIDNKLLYTVPVKFIKEKNHNEISFAKKELLDFLKKDSCLECKIVYPRILGTRRFSNSFYIPSAELLTLLEE